MLRFRKVPHSLHAKEDLPYGNLQSFRQLIDGLQAGVEPSSLHQADEGQMKSRLLSQLFLGQLLMKSQLANSRPKPFNEFIVQGFGLFISQCRRSFNSTSSKISFAILCNNSHIKASLVDKCMLKGVG